MSIHRFFPTEILMKRIILGGVLAVGTLAGFGCTASVGTAPVAIGADVDLGPDAVYYDRGGYVGDVWVWHDQQGREMREARSVHENRVTRSHAQANPQQAKEQVKPQQTKEKAKPQAEHQEEHQASHEEHK